MLLEWGILKGNNTGIDGIEIRTMLIRGASRMRINRLIISGGMVKLIFMVFLKL